MSIYKGQYIFEGRGRGWTEVWYWLASTGTLDMQGARFLATFDVRRLLLGKEYGFKGIRVSEELTDLGQPVLNDSWLRREEQLGYQSEPGWEEDLALVVKCQSLDRSKRRNIFMRGLWDKIEDNGGAYMRGYGTWISKWDAWYAKMKDLGVGWIHRTPGAKINVVSAVMNQDNEVVLTMEANIFTAGPNGYKATQLNVRTAGKKSVLSGIQIVLPTSATSCKIIKPLAIFPTVTTGWTANIFSLGFQVADWIEDSHITRRPSGSPLLESPGRAKAKARG